MREDRHPNANTVMIDSGRFKRFFYMRRISLNAIGPMFGRCAGWGSVIAARGCAGYWALDELATALDIHVNTLIEEVGTDEELKRLSVA